MLRYDETEGIVDQHEGDDQSILGLSGVRVTAEKLDTVNKAGTATEILRDALGVPTTIPGWAEARTEELLQEFRGKELSNEALDELGRSLDAEGLSGQFPDALRELTSRQ